MDKNKKNSGRKRIDGNLLQEEMKFRIIADNTYDFEFWINPQDMYLYASPACKRITGYKPEEFIKDPGLRIRITHPDDLSIVNQHIHKKEKKHLVSETEYRIFHKNGSVRWISHACQPVFSDKGEYLGLRGSNRDITERKNAEEEIIHLASFPELNPRPICEVDFKGNVRYMNPALKRLFPQIARIGIRHPWFTDFKTDIIPKFRTGAKDTMTRELAIGKYHFEQGITYAPARGRIRIYGQDITERKKTEDALRRSEECFQIVSRATSDTVWDWDLITNRLLWNKNIEILFGYPKTDLETDIKWWDEKLHPEDRRRVLSSIDAVIESGEQFWSQEYRFRHADDSYVYVLDRGFVIRDEKGFAIRMIGSMMDLTEHKNKELELQKLNRTLMAIHNSSQAMMRAMDESDYLKEVCRIIVKDCGHSMVWVGFAQDDAAKTVRPVAQAGLEKGYLEKLNLTWSDTELGRGPTGTAIRTGKPAMCKNILTDPAFKPWREEAIKRGYASSIVFPLLNNKKAFGAINIYSKKPDPFSEEEVNLLAELSNDLAYGIMTLRARVEHKQLEQSLQKSHDELERRIQERTKQLTSERQRLYDVMDTLPVYVLLLTEDYHTPFANRFFREHFGESGGRRCFEYLFKRSQPCENCQTYEVLKTNKPHRWEWLGPDGRNYDIYDFPFKDIDGSRMIMEMGIDITERKRAEKELRQVSLYVRNLIEASLDPLVTISAEGKITDVNNATELVTGYRRDELIGTDFSNYFTEPEKARSGYQQVFKEGLVRDYPLDICHRNGHTTPVLYNAAVYRNEKGEVVGIFAAARDISKRKQAEEALLEVQNEIEIAKRLSSIGMLANTVAHELRNPLAAIKLAGYNIKRKAKNPDLDKHILNIETKLTESEQIISNLLFYSKIKMPRLGKINLHNILNACVREAKDRFSKYSVKIEKNTRSIKDLLIEADPLQIKEIFSNTLNNAFDAFAEHTGGIKIEAKADEKRVRVLIKDTGTGISKEDLERIFEPFFTTKAKGTGLGLSICQQIAHLHNGSINIESEKGKGTTVTVALPIKQKKNA